jgi:tetratricopeptide (TPR) repeat protein
VGPLGCLAFGEGELQILWSIEPTSPAGNSCHWLMRAAASLGESPQNPDYREALQRHYAAPGTEHYYVLGRHMLGLAPESAALALRVTPHAACEVYFYIGYLAQADGRFADAARWYERCVATGESRNAEYYWAVAQLSSWAGKMQTLERLEAANRTSRVPPSLSMLGFADASLNSN